jgi:uncharacterized protein involved in exopolysaccharide biosynthesis
MILTIKQLKRLIYLSLYKIIDNLQLVFLPLIIVPFVVILLSMNVEKQYANHATILIEESSLLNPYLDKLEFSFELSKRIDALRTLVLSRKSLNEIINEVEYFKKPKSPDEINKLQKDLERSVSISLVGDELVYINFKWNERDQMKEILSLLVEKFIEKLLAPTKASLDSSELFFKKQLLEIRKELEGAEDKLAKFKRENRDTLPELLNINQGTLTSLEQKKQEKSIELSGAKAGLKTLKLQLSKTNPIMGKIEEQIIELELEIETLRAKYTDNHSILQIKIKKINKLKERKKELKTNNTKMNIDSLWQIANTLPFGANKNKGALLLSQLINLEKSNNNLAQLENEIKMITEQIAVISKRLSSSSEIDKSLRQLQRDYKVKQDLYSKMLERYEMSKVTGKLVKYEGPDKVKTIERAYSPTTPINNSIIINSIIGIFLGILTSITITFVLVIGDLRVIDLDTIKKISGKSVLTKLPIIKN